MLSSKIILITGASGGIGYAIMENFVGKVKYLITSSRKELSEFMKLDPPPENLEHISKDLTIEEDVKELFRYIIKKYRRLDLLINCIGGSLFKHPIEDFPIEEYDEVMEVNLKSAFLLTKYAIKTIKNNKDEGGNIIHFVSSSAKNIAEGKAPYGIAKAALAHLIHYAAYEAAKYNIKINGISPTYVFTPRHEIEINEKIENLEEEREEIVKNIFSRQLLKKEMHPKDLLDLVELLATTECITGQIYNCDMGEILFY